MIRVIAFDLDDTLWDSWEVLTRAEEHLQSWLDEHVPQLEYSVTGMRELRTTILEEDPGLVHYITEFRRKIIERAMYLSGIPLDRAVSTSHDAMDAFLEARNTIDLAPATIDTLRRLSRRFTLGALTNGNANIETLGLSALFSFAYSAEDIGAAKPAPDLFLAALAHTGSSPEQMVYVGDDPVLDIDPAKQVGLHTILMRNPRKDEPGETPPDEIISEIPELPAAVDRILSRTRPGPR